MAIRQHDLANLTSPAGLTGRSSRLKLGHLPTTDRPRIGDVVMKVLQSEVQIPEQRGSGGGQMRITPWRQYRAHDLQPSTVAFCYVVTLYSRQSQEIWICNLRSSSPNELVVNNGLYRIIMTIYPRRGAVIGNSAVDSKGNQLPPHTRLFTLLIPADVPMIYNATLQLIKDGAVLCHEIVISIRMNLPGVGSSCVYQNDDQLEVEYPIPKIKITGVLRHAGSWSTIRRFENFTDNGQFELYRRHRKMLENWAKTRPQYQDLVAMIFLEEGVACNVERRRDEAISLAKQACRLSSHYSCVNDRLIRGYASAVYAAAERMVGNLDSAKQHLSDALEIFEPMEPSPYTSIALYNIGCITMEKSATVGITETEEREAESFLHKAAEHWMYQQLNTTIVPRVYNRLVSLYLKSSPDTAPDLNVVVSQDNLARAGDVIRRFENSFPHCSKWMKSMFCLGKTDYFIRTRDIEGGMRAAQQALEVSLQSGLQRETTGAIRRMDLLRELDNNRRPPEVPATL